MMKRRVLKLKVPRSYKEDNKMDIRFVNSDNYNESLLEDEMLNILDDD